MDDIASVLAQYLSGDGGLRTSAGMDADQILQALKKKGAISSDFMTGLKADLLARAAAMQQLGSM